MSQRTDTRSLAVEAVRAACLEAALLAYEDAGIRGLCAEGRWEAALAAIRHVDLSRVIEPPATPVGGGSDGGEARPTSPTEHV